MGRYLSLRLRFEGTQSLTGLLEPLFSTPFFDPVALGGVQMRDAGDRWFSRATPSKTSFPDSPAQTRRHR